MFGLTGNTPAITASKLYALGLVPGAHLSTAPMAAMDPRVDARGNKNRNNVIYSGQPVR
jgi:hypothetical protein